MFSSGNVMWPRWKLMTRVVGWENVPWFKHTLSQVGRMQTKWVPNIENLSFKMFQIFGTKVEVVNVIKIRLSIYHWKKFLKLKYWKWTHILHLKLWTKSFECKQNKRSQRHQGQSLFQGLHLTCGILVLVYFFIFYIFHAQFTILC